MTPTLAEELRAETERAKERAKKRAKVLEETRRTCERRERESLIKCVEIIEKELRRIAKAGCHSARFRVADDATTVFLGDSEECVSHVYLTTSDTIYEKKTKELLSFICQYFQKQGLVIKLYDIFTSYGQYKGNHYRIVISW